MPGHPGHRLLLLLLDHLPQPHRAVRLPEASRDPSIGQWHRGHSMHRAGEARHRIEGEDPEATGDVFTATIRHSEAARER
ncbi:hypothetical protein [Cryobacterium sp. TMT2-42-4]|uniref:hypothetical protein n=1 Tax=Cryobacterium sp. TMT2-42-4 TaxID=1259255 RepID=UPI00106CEA55|nr:hypothetical protein [Cryobacterium sp. TMT2-42-4]TFC40266.1 hypothetical protein E3O18_00060 [Cryobacterium sp. TMT2-42-4]